MGWADLEIITLVIRARPPDELWLVRNHKQPGEKAPGSVSLLLSYVSFPSAFFSPQTREPWE